MIRKVNTLFMALTIVFAAGFIVSTIRAAWADPFPGPCPDPIGTANCAEGYYSIITHTAYACYYGDPFTVTAGFPPTTTTYYHCCKYDVKGVICRQEQPQVSQYYQGAVQYLIHESTGAGACPGNGECLEQ